MDISKHELYFSVSRIGRYYVACGKDGVKATELYRLNIQLSQALYPLISILEVALRNAIDRELSKYFGDSHWLITKRALFANHPALVFKDKRGNSQPDHFFTDKINDAEAKLKFRGIPITHGKLLAELTFGFWVKFYDNKSIKILQGAQIRAFQNSPKMPMTVVHSHLNQIVALRNRISHNEPICFNKTGQICLKTIEGYENDICNALGWLNHELKIWSDIFNVVQPIIIMIKQSAGSPNP
jgi:hypothetical protein